MKKTTMKIWGYKLARKNKKVKKGSKKGRRIADMRGLRGFYPYVVILVMLVSALTLLGVCLRNYFIRGETFSIKNVLLNKPPQGVFRGLEADLEKRYAGRNIFSVIPSQVEMLLREDYAHLRMIRVRRVFPDTLEIDLVPRESFACLDASGGVVVDRGGMILSVGECQKGLVRIKGVSFFLSRPRPGNMVNDRHAQDALFIADNIMKQTGIAPEEIEAVDVSDRNNFVVTVSGVPVKLGVDDFERKISVLGGIFSDARIDPEGLRYIDLRFRDPVYAYKRN